MVCSLAKLAIFVTVDFPFMFPLLSLSYFISLTLWHSPFPFFIFLWGSLADPQFLGNGLAPKSSHVATVTAYIVPGQT